MVTADGTLALFCGNEPPCWTTTELDQWIRNEGQMLRIELTRPEPANDHWHDPFCGWH
jgi:hypothetical protein